MFTTILKEEDALKENHFPIIPLLNEAYNTDIIGFIKELIQGVGSGYNYTTCSFWEELDDYDKERIAYYNGVMIETEAGEELYLSMRELFVYLVLLKNKVSLENSDLANKISLLLDEYKIVYKDAL
jgi:hypothetical protein